MSFDSLIVKIKKADSPLFSVVKRTAKFLLTFQLPVPSILFPIFRILRALQLLVVAAWTRVVTVLYRYPVFRSRCECLGKRLELERIPSITGPVKIFVGDDVRISGIISIDGGRIFDAPEIRIGNRTFIGHGCTFLVGKEITIGDDVLIAGHCYLADYSAHPLEPDRRAAGEQVAPEKVRPIRVEKHAWLGRGAVILPGVTIGEGAVIGAGAVVTKDVPAGQICVGNPGKLLARAATESR